MNSEQIKAQLEICNNRLTCEALREIIRLREALEKIKGLCGCTEICDCSSDMTRIAKQALSEEAGK